MARRLVEVGVKFVEVNLGGWDNHRDIFNTIGAKAGELDSGMATLIAELQQRRMLDETLVVFATEFGRTPFNNKADAPGREHHNWAFTTFLAGGGVKGGVTHGATDEIGLKAVDNPIHTHDFHATILHLLGLDHERLTHFHDGRDFRLTDVSGHVVKSILA